MGPRAKLKAALDRVAELKKHDGDFSAEQLEEITKLDADIKSAREAIAANDRAAAALKSIGDEPNEGDGDQLADDDEPAGGMKSGGARTAPRGGVKTYGEMFTKSDAYARFAKEYPSGVSNGSPVNIGRVKVGDMAGYFRNRKDGTLTTGDARLAPMRLPTVDMVDRARLSLLDLISRGQTDGNFDYVQVRSVTRNAKIVPEATSGTDDAALKPTSDIETGIEDAKVWTYADGYDVTNQLLSRAPAFASYMNNELAYSLDDVIEDTLLNSDGENGRPRGILHTTGVQEVTYTGGTGDTITSEAAFDFIRAARRGITAVTRRGRGGKVDAVLLSPELDEAIDLLQDSDGRFLGNGPFSMGPGTLWGRPRVVSERLDPLESLLGDFKQVALLDCEGLSVQVFNQHKDYAQRNLNYVRAELSAAQAFWRPNRMVHIAPAAAAGA
ncbi:phage major capsid protein [Rhodococcus sp. 14-2470-1a]|uniref:phage major capsid protein n=1 Tax=Rhodococcus sp. 14-2470-1a TaxID=2023150 RepID=UPI000B9AE6A2|nr:phage major capsid protein [Rhodococcus sp. 14-2470-1a]OZF41911.1 phage major capsid protein [Rhodococcus sp. 14-2470-1a]